MKLNVPCEVTMNGDYPTYKEEWDNFSDAESYCDSLVRRGLCTYYKIESLDGGATLIYRDEE